MRTKDECISCLRRQTRTFSNIMTDDSLIKEKIIDFGYSEIERCNYHETAPKITADIFHHALRLTGLIDPYKKEKIFSNNIATEVVKNLKLEEMVKGENGFEHAVKLSIAGNIIDFSALEEVEDEYIYSTVKKSLDAKLFNLDPKQFEKDIKNANKIMFIADNAGEIVFDQLLLSKIDLSKVVFVVKQGPIINDATIEDCKMIGLDEQVHIIDNGTAIQGCDLRFCSEEFIKEFEQAELIISKGQANYETLEDIKDRNIYFLLMAKCQTVADNIGCNKGEYVLINNK
jgi:uncharacterized protein with ATP-grasp and redox domains